MRLERGFRGKLTDYLDVNQPIQVRLSTAGSAVYDTCCFGVDSAEKLSDDRYMVFYNQPNSPNNEISYSNQYNSAVYTVNLTRLPSNIAKLVFTVSIDGYGTMSQIQSHTIDIIQNGSTVMQLSLSGSDFQNEKAIIGIEIYNKTVWRVAVVARGFFGGLGDLLKSFGGEIADPQPAPPPAPVPPPQPAPAPFNNRSDRFSSASGRTINDSYRSSSSGFSSPPPQPAPSTRPVELKKGQKVNLVKQNTGGSQEIIINLNWHQSKGFFGGHAIDLDLECLYEMNTWEGTKGGVQAIGRNFGSLYTEPYIMLDGDDRSGTSLDGENLKINAQMISKIKRILVYTSIYEGATNWAAANGVATIKCPGNADVVIRLDEGNSRYRICAIAMLEYNGNNGFTVEKLERYFESKPEMDRAYNWGLQWTRGSK